MLGWLAALIGGPVIDGLISAYKARLDAAQTSERIAADLAAERLRAEIAARQAAREIVIAEQGHWFTALPRPLFALIVLVYAGKVVIWDSVLGLGATPAVGGSVGDWMGWIVAAYFGGRTLEKIAGSARRRP